MNRNLSDSISRLISYCEKTDFKGWDPYDGLNSRVFQSVPLLKKSALCRLLMIQGFKKSPVNMRRLFRVPKEYNAKGVALFLEGYCRLYGVSPQEETLSRIRFLADLLLSLRSEGYSGSCWGYNFDWQARRLFLFPKGTPTVVATGFAVQALLKASEITGEQRYLDAALSSAEFILRDLHRTPCGEGFLFSYSPLQGNDTVINASLFGSRILALLYRQTGKEEYLEAARHSAAACCSLQEQRGAWRYGLLPEQSWVDSFHTGYNLDSLMIYSKMTGDDSFVECMEMGFDYYLRSFFTEEGVPKYYDDRMYPIDIHCPGQLLVTLDCFGRTEQYRELAEKVLDWTLDHMQDREGYFYYQLKMGISSRIPYMRWSNAFMFNALASLVVNKNE